MPGKMELQAARELEQKKSIDAADNPSLKREAEQEQLRRSFAEVADQERRRKTEEREAQKIQAEVFARGGGQLAAPAPLSYQQPPAVETRTAPVYWALVTISGVYKVCAVLSCVLSVIAAIVTLVKAESHFMDAAIFSAIMMVLFGFFGGLTLLFTSNAIQALRDIAQNSFHQTNLLVRLVQQAEAPKG